MRRRRVVVVAYVSTIRWNTSCTQKSARTCIDTKKHYDQIIHTRSLKNAYVRLDRETCIRSTPANTASLLFAPFFPIVPHKYDDTLRETRSNPQTGALFGTHYFRRKARWWSLLACSGGTFAFAFNVVVVFGNEEAFTKGHSEGGRALLSASTKRRFVVVVVVVVV